MGFDGPKLFYIKARFKAQNLDEEEDVVIIWM